MLDGRGLLLPNSDFTVSENIVTVVDAWNAGDVGGLLILKNVPMGEDGSVSGAVIAPGTIPASALAEEYLPLDGSKSMKGNQLLLNNGYGSVWSDNLSAILQSLNSPLDYENRRRLVIRNANSERPLNEAIYFAESIDGVDQNYSLYGEHNKPTAEELGFVPLDGSVSATGALKVLGEVPFYYAQLSGNNSQTLFGTAGTGAVIANRNIADTTDNYRALQLFNSAEQTDVTNAIRLQDRISGKNTYYNIYGEHNKPTASDVGALPDTTTAVDIGGRPNTNLLHNWYFGNPVNGKGLNVYNLSGYKITIDRWMSESSCIVNVNDSNITLETASDVWAIFFQQIRSEVARQMIGRKVTYSILVDSIETGTCRAYIYDGSSVVARIEPLEVGMNSVTFDYSFAETVSPTVRIQLQGLCKVSVKAVKLELGDKQTLAHQDDDGNWVLNEIPDYAEQVAICQQYSTANGSYIGNSVPVWYPITSLTNGTPHDDNTCGYWVQGNQVVVYMRIAKGFSMSSWAEIPLFTLPSGFRPSRRAEAQANAVNSTTLLPIKGYCKTNGEVGVYTYTSGTTAGVTVFQLTFFIE